MVRADGHIPQGVCLLPSPGSQHRHSGTRPPPPLGKVVMSPPQLVGRGLGAHWGPRAELSPSQLCWPTASHGHRAEALMPSPGLARSGCSPGCWPVLREVGLICCWASGLGVEECRCSSPPCPSGSLPIQDAMGQGTKVPGPEDCVGREPTPAAPSGSRLSCSSSLGRREGYLPGVRGRVG